MQNHLNDDRILNAYLKLITEAGSSKSMNITGVKCNLISLGDGKVSLFSSGSSVPDAVKKAGDINSLMQALNIAFETANGGAGKTDIDKFRSAHPEIFK